MPRTRSDGGLIGLINTPTTSVAGGIWTYKDVERSRRSSIWPSPSPLAEIVNAVILAVGGGGGGGAWATAGLNGGGGGAGGLIYNSSANLVTTSNYTVLVGAGGASSSNGTDTSIIGTNINYVSLGGGAGGGQTYGANASSGGSGGGRGGASSNLPGAAGLQPTSASGGFGNPGGYDSIIPSTQAAGGGGGAAAPGANGNAGGVGGAGLGYNFANGTLLYYAGGGGGAIYPGGPNAGGVGGGGRGGTSAAAPLAGANNTGGGGGGSQDGGGGPGGNGGSGVVIVSYSTPQKYSGGRIQILNNSNVVHTFYTSESMNALPQPIDTFFHYNALLIHADGANTSNNKVFTDSSLAPLPLESIGTPAQGTISPYSQYSNTSWSVYHKNGDYINFNGVAVGTNPYTIEAWLCANQTLTASTTEYITSATNGLNLRIANTFVQVDMNAVSNQQFVLPTLILPDGSANNTIVPGYWYNIVVTRDVSNRTTVWVNGQRSPTGVVTMTNNYSGLTNRIGNNFEGWISNLRFSANTSLYNVNNATIAVPNSPYTNLSSTALLTNQSNRFIDTSGSAFNFTPTFSVVGTPAIQSFSPFSPNTVYSTANNIGSIYYNGSTDYIRTTLSGNRLNYSSNANWTFEAWVYPLSRATQIDLIGRGDTGATLDWSIYINTSGNLVFYNLNGALTLTSSSTVTLNCWTHVAASIVNGLVTLYINGVAVSAATAVNAASVASASTNYFICGGMNGRFPNLYYSDLRIVNGSAVYTANFNPPTAPLQAITNTALLLRGTGANIIDQTGRNVIQTFGNSFISTVQSRFGNTSLSFNGTNSYLTIPQSQYMTLGSSYWTIEFWIYPTTFASAQTPLFLNGDGSGWAALRLDLLTSGALQILSAAAAGAWNVNYTLPIPLKLNQWQHIAIVRNASQYSVYVDGQLNGQVQNFYGALYRGLTLLNYIGVTGSLTQYFNGFIDEFRFTRGVNRYYSNTTFTVPTTPYLNR